ncbi:MAG: glycoside hydrolase family 15 protein [Brevibacillus sp.]|nr:glycoside hydrolase family 15 protein [Brevibacillus sp.]
MGRRSYYGITGNGQTAALISPTLSVDWMCIPRFDGFPIFAKALDPHRGGCFSLRVDKPIRPISQTYLGRTNVLRTEVSVDALSITAVDYMPWGRPLLIRELLVCNTGDKAIHFPVRFAAVPTRTTARAYDKEEEDGIVYVSDAASVLACRTEQRQERIAPGETVEVRVVLAYGRSRQEALAALESAAAETADQTVRTWENWISSAAPIQLGNTDWEEAYYRSLLVLKLLCSEETGAILAAPTASFPAVPHGGDNWDYRYVWLRDGYYTAYTLDACGLHEESRRFYEFVFTLQEPDGSWRQPLYTIDGGNPSEMIISDLTGPNGERPIRFGNEAANQLQLDNNGNIVHGVWFHYRQTRDRAFLLRYWPQIKLAVEWLIKNWNQPENGIWEIRERLDHWLHGKAMCFACFEAGADIALTLGYKELSDRWREMADRVKRQIEECAWNERRQAFLQSYSDDAPLDISVLALVFYGIVDAADERMVKTVQKMEQPLVRPLQPTVGYTTADPYAGLEKGGLNIDGGIARYDYAHVPFYLPTIWLARYYLFAGNRQRAKELIDTCIACSTSLYLMAEHFDPRTRQQWGNFPQAFSHEELARILLEWHLLQEGSSVWLPTF